MFKRPPSIRIDGKLGRWGRLYVAFLWVWQALVSGVVVCMDSHPNEREELDFVYGLIFPQLGSMSRFSASK
jgi:hypothetical protein